MMILVYKDAVGINWLFGRSLRAGLYAHTARALATGPVSAPIPNAKHPWSMDYWPSTILFFLLPTPMLQ
jgi:hypothetical protein